MPYEKLTLQNQRIWLDKYFNRVYKPYCDRYIYIYEINKSGNLHVHGFLFDAQIQTPYDLLCLRDTVNKNPYTLCHLNNIKLAKIFNNIVYCADVNNTSEYISKDAHDSLKHFGYVTQDDKFDPSDILIHI